MECQPNHIENTNFLQHKNEPIIGFSPDRTRFDSSTNTQSSSTGGGAIDISDLLLDKKGIELSTRPLQNLQSNGIDGKVLNSGNGGTQLQKKLERHIAQAYKVTPPASRNSVNQNHTESFCPSKLDRVINPTDSTSNGSLKVRVLASPNHTMIPPGSDSRSKALLPPQRLAVPRKLSNILPHLHTQEVKPLVQWDTEDSEDELSFFPESTKARARLTDNLSVDNLSLSGEEEDLHLTPPRIGSPGHCPCDPRPLFQAQLTRLRRTQACTIT